MDAATEADAVSSTQIQHEADLTKGMEHLRPYVSVPSVQSPALQILDPSIYGIPASVVNPPRRAPQRTQSPSNLQKRTDPFQFGSRLLEEGDDIFEFNAWDHVEVDDTFKEFAELQYQRQRDSPVTDFDKTRFNNAPEKWWNRFYTNNASNFFKDRKWLFQEFPVLTAATSADSPPVTILELGAGAGNTAFPILAANKNPALRLHACDFSAKAVDLIRNNPLYNPMHIQADVWDVAETAETNGHIPPLPPGLAPGSVDIVIMIFIFSALAPSQWDQALRNIYSLLKPGGQILFRDYGRGDLAQVRFKKGRWLEENFYIRGDGTRVYFFEKDELVQIFGGAPQEEDASAATDEHSAVTATKDEDSEAQTYRFEIKNLGVDRRMLVNRQRKLKMYRCWMQGLFKKQIASNL